MTEHKSPADEEFMIAMTELIDGAAERMTPWQFRVACWKMNWMFSRIRLWLLWKGFVKWWKR